MEWQYEGHTIEVNEQGMFVAKVGEVAVRSDTLDGAYSQISRFAKAALKAEKVDLQVVTEELKQCTITGLHLGTSSITTRPTQTRLPSYVYPDVEGARTPIEAYVTAGDAHTAAYERLKPLQIPTSYGYGAIRLEDHDRLFAKLKDNYANALRRASE